MIGIATYARIAGVVLLALTVGGVVRFGWSVASVFAHAGVGLLFLYVGFSRMGAATVRPLVGGLGALLLIVMAVAIFSSWLLPVEYLHGPIQVTGVIVGITSILAAGYLPEQRSPRRGRVD